MNRIIEYRLELKNDQLIASGSMKLKQMKSHIAPGLSGLIAEMTQATGDIGNSLDIGFM